MPILLFASALASLSASRRRGRRRDGPLVRRRPDPLPRRGKPASPPWSSSIAGACDRHLWDAAGPGVRPAPPDRDAGPGRARRVRPWTARTGRSRPTPRTSGRSSTGSSLRSVILVGHSMGGPVIVEAARTMPSASRRPRPGRQPARTSSEKEKPEEVDAFLGPSRPTSRRPPRSSSATTCSCRRRIRGSIERLVDKTAAAPAGRRDRVPASAPGSTTLGAALREIEAADPRPERRPVPDPSRRDSPPAPRSSKRRS